MKKLATWMTVLVVAGFGFPTGALADSEYYLYHGQHPYPYSVVGDSENNWCEETGFHYHPFPPDPDELQFYIVEDGAFYFVGDPSFYHYSGDVYWYYDPHPIDYFGYHHICYISGPHTHYFAPTTVYLEYYYYDSYSYIWYGPWPWTFVPGFAIFLNEIYGDRYHHSHKHAEMHRHYAKHAPPSEHPRHNATRPPGEHAAKPKFATPEKPLLDKDRTRNVPIWKGLSDGHSGMMPTGARAAKPQNLPDRAMHPPARGTEPLPPADGADRRGYHRAWKKPGGDSTPARSFGDEGRSQAWREHSATPRVPDRQPSRSQPSWGDDDWKKRSAPRHSEPSKPRWKSTPSGNSHRWNSSNSSRNPSSSSPSNRASFSDHSKPGRSDSGHSRSHSAPERSYRSAPSSKPSYSLPSSSSHRSSSSGRSYSSSSNDDDNRKSSSHKSSGHSSGSRPSSPSSSFGRRR
jgi:hypothetical protein